MSIKYHPLTAGVKAALLTEALGTEIHRFGGSPAPERAAWERERTEVVVDPQHGQVRVDGPAVDPVRDANLVLPRKDARREILAKYIAQRDTCLKACIEDVLGFELTDPAEQLMGHNLVEMPAAAEGDELDATIALPLARWFLDGVPLLDAPALRIYEASDQSRGDWRRFVLLRNLPDEVLADLPPTIYRRG